MSSIYLLFVLLLFIFNFWTVYNIPIVAVGVRHLLRARRKRRESPMSLERELPTVSIVVPVRNEEKVVGRLLNALLKLEYPVDKKEIIVVNDASTDKTSNICLQYSSRNAEIIVVNRPRSTTKAAALNFGVHHAKGEIIATFDADSVPESDALLNAVKYFSDSSVAGVQGRICSINSEENMLTKFLSYEGAVQYELYQRGKDALHLFVSLAGTCQFVRRSALEEVGGWDEDCLAEDLELSLKLTEKNSVIRYASEARTWEESPFNAKSLIRQRARWYRGNIEVAARFGKLMKRPNLRRFDAEMTVFGTFIILLCIINYFMAPWSFLIPQDFVIVTVSRLMTLFTLVILGSLGVALGYVARSFSVRSVFWLPFIYVYWGLQSFIVLYSLFQIVLRRPRTWSKTARSGLVTGKR